MRYLVVILAGLAAFTVASLADVVTIEQIIAKVNGEIITNVDLDHDRADLEKQLKANGLTGPRTFWTKAPILRPRPLPGGVIGSTPVSGSGSWGSSPCPAVFIRGAVSSRPRGPLMWPRVVAHDHHHAPPGH